MVYSLSLREVDRFGKIVWETPSGLLRDPKLVVGIKTGHSLTCVWRVQWSSSDSELLPPVMKAIEIKYTESNWNHFLEKLSF